MHDLLSWKRVASLIKFLRMGFISYCIICKIKDALIFGKIDTKSSRQEMSLKALRTLWIFWIFQRFLWNYLKLNCVLNSCKLWTLYVLPLGCDMWLSSDYLARYYSLCDIGILVPIFVMVMSSGFVSAMSFGFVLAIVMWCWVRFSSLERCCYCSQCIVRSFMLRYIEEYYICNFMRAF